MPRVIHFELPADDPERAVRFYERVFDWKINKWDGPVDYWLITTGEDSQPGINGAIMRREPGDVTRNTLAVSSVDEFAGKVVREGGQIVAPRMTIPSVGYLAFCKDTEGNIFGIIEEDSTAS